VIDCRLVGATGGAARLGGLRKERSTARLRDYRPPQHRAPCVNRACRGRADAPSPSRANRDHRRDRQLWPAARRSSPGRCRLAGARWPPFAPSRTPWAPPGSSAQAALEPRPRWPGEWCSRLTPQAPPFSSARRLAPLSSRRPPGLLSPHVAAAQARQETGPRRDCRGLSRELFRECEPGLHDSARRYLE
jgi:hypothetical protein